VDCVGFFEKANIVFAIKRYNFVNGQKARDALHFISCGVALQALKQTRVYTDSTSFLNFRAFIT